MTQVGRVAEICRYPVKSMGGESLRECEIGAGGLLGDRTWAVRDEGRGAIEGARTIPGLLDCNARYLEGASLGDAPVPQLTLPDGATLRADEPDAAKRLSEALGLDVTLWPRLPASDLDHYRRAPLDPSRAREQIREMFAREPDEPMPDLSQFPPELMQFATMPGTYFDAYPMLVLTDRSLSTLAKASPDSKMDARRFRPNLLIESSEDAPYPEFEWTGRRVRVGGAVIRIESPAPRCRIPTLGFADLPKDPLIMRALVRETQGNLGSYASVEEAGMVRTGDPVELL
ncbi:MAG: MOSC domain-containing protein [Deltaproteobacteria bacterium]|nr:MOSC domain-containing protein [Deltaproteobacteria bacterium]